MSVERSRGVVLRIRSLTETSLIVHWLTLDYGRLATVAKGARRAKSPFRGKLDLFYEAELSFQRSRRSELHTLREVVLREIHPELRRDLGYLQQASYCAELLEMATETDTPLRWAFELVRGFLAHLPSRPPQSQTILALELRLLGELGLQPDLEQVRLSPGTRELARILAHGNWAMASRLRLSRDQDLELRQFLQGFLLYHLGRVPRGRPVALNAGSVNPFQSQSTIQGGP